MIATIDGEWLVRNAPKIYDATAAAAGLEFHRGTEEFLAMVKEIGTPDLEKRELFRGVFDGRYKLVRYYSLNNYNLPQSLEELLSHNSALFPLSS